MNFLFQILSFFFSLFLFLARFFLASYLLVVIFRPFINSIGYIGEYYSNNKYSSYKEFWSSVGSNIKYIAIMLIFLSVNALSLKNGISGLNPVTTFILILFWILYFIGIGLWFRPIPIKLQSESYPKKRNSGLWFLFYSYYIIIILMTVSAVKYVNNGNSWNEKSSNLKINYSEKAAKKINLGNYESSIYDLNKAIELDSLNPENYRNRAYSKFNLNDNKEALIDLNRAIFLNPEYLSALSLRAIIKIDLEEFGEALIDLDKSIDLDSDRNPNNYSNRSLVKTKLDDYNGALKDINISIKLRSKMSGVSNNEKIAKDYHLRARIKQKLSDFDGSLTDFDYAVKFNPEISMYFNDRGHCKMMHFSNYKSAINDFNEAIQKDAKNINAFSNKAYANFILGNYESSIKNYTNIISLNPVDPEIYFLRSQRKIDINDFNGALNDLEKAISLNPQYEKAYASRGFVKQNFFQDYNGAVEDYSNAIILDPKNSINFNNRGYAYLSLGKYEASLADLNESIKLNESLPNPYKHRAIVKIKFNNDYYGAVEDLDKAIRLDSNYSIAFKERGIAKKYLKMPYCEDFNSACILGDKEACDLFDVNLCP